MQLDSYALINSVCRESFYDFVQTFWHVVIPEEPVWNWHIEYLCDELQTAAEKVFRRQARDFDEIFNVPPGTSKSTIGSVMYQPWVWTRMPTARFLTATHTEQLGHDLSVKSRDIVQSLAYQKAFGIELSADQNTKGYWKNTARGSRMTATVGGKNPMGFHAHFIGVDDPIDPQKILSEAEIKQANDFMNHTLPSRKVDKDTTFTYLIMQRLGQNDPTGNLLAQITKGLRIKLVSLPAERTENIKPSYLAKKYVDGLLDPVRLSRDVLDQFKIKGEYYYAGQFLQTPIPPGGGMFKTSELHVGTEPPRDIRFRKVWRFWDNAGTKDGDGAYTAGVKMGETYPRPGERYGDFWVLDVIRGRWEVFGRERIKKNTAKLDGDKTRIGQEQEPGSSGKDVARWTIRNLAGFKVQAERPTGNKVARAEPFSGMVNAGFVHLAPGEWNTAYIEEMSFFPFSTHKDQIDASSGAFNMLTRAIKIGAV